MNKGRNSINQSQRNPNISKDHLFKLDNYPIKQLARYKHLSIQSKTVQYSFQSKVQNSCQEKEGQIIQSTRERKKIKKDVLNNCFNAITQCYQTILGTLNLVFHQLIKLNHNATNAAYARIIYNQTVKKGLAHMKNISESSRHLNQKYQSLYTSSQQITRHIIKFCKQLRLQEKQIELPSQQGLFRSIYDK